MFTLAHLFSTKHLLQLESMIEYMIPDSSPLVQFADYGCFCGLGGQGTPVDQLDQCCFTHDGCYYQARHLESCSGFEPPYTIIYDYSWDEINKITCLASNDACAMFVCQCDKNAAECFALAPYNSSNVNLPSSLCSSAPREKSSFSIMITIFTLALTICLAHIHS
ncbi:hypothetical protein DNTS_015192 [Danionella cerebrum]|uniref:Phospholipase A2 n=1 Tax=Danionella cerebrum TaxID=2873325 RepID=A0A553NJE6_9TELE|nr:hypothetical protein DNTS_015192 [Danionella translucida]